MTTGVFEVIGSSRTNARVDWKSIVEVVVAKTGVSKREIMGRRRTRRIAHARHAICYLARLLSKMSYEEIGILLGRDHSTIIYAVDQITEQVRLKVKSTTLVIDTLLAELGSSSQEPQWRIEVVDPDLGGEECGAGYPGLRVIYKRPDGQEWIGIVSMCPRRA